MLDELRGQLQKEFLFNREELSKNLHENLSKINGEFKDNELVTEVIKFIEKDKKRPICSPQS